MRPPPSKKKSNIKMKLNKKKEKKKHAHLRGELIVCVTSIFNIFLYNLLDSYNCHLGGKKAKLKHLRFVISDFWTLLYIYIYIFSFSRPYWKQGCCHSSNSSISSEWFETRKIISGLIRSLSLSLCVSLLIMEYNAFTQSNQRME